MLLVFNYFLLINVNIHSKIITIYIKKPNSFKVDLGEHTSVQINAHPHTPSWIYFNEVAWSHHNSTNEVLHMPINTNCHKISA